ncbi:MAG: hypothetical protein JWM88_3050 [Verrucomicrobia bacterium]|nr:hypothetical protein [Verrucomicrobiota bacterium]
MEIVPFVHAPMLNSVDTKSPTEVAVLSLRVFHELFPGAEVALLSQAFADIEKLFSGRHPGYRPIDLGYHNLEHTLQATVCLTYLLEGAQKSGEATPITARQYELAVLTALLHDTGYLKIRSDESGTGAKYTLTHVLRSCAFAASYLPTIGVEDHEIGGILGAINCTGPSNEIGRLGFNNPTDKFIGCAMATADYLGQMAAPDYPDKLDILYGEFLESDNFLSMPEQRRLFKSPEDLTRKTPDFWAKFIRPRLENQLERVYRFLARPFPHGPNVYLEAVERNIEIVRQRIAANTVKAG